MTADLPAEAKRAAAIEAVRRFVFPGMSIGLGSGSTSEFAIVALAQRLRDEPALTLHTIVCTSAHSDVLARSLGLDVSPLGSTTGLLDLTIDGADEIDPHLNTIKGGGGALLREKLVAVRSRSEVIIADWRKSVETLGKTFRLPVVIVPFGWETTRDRVEAICGRAAQLRRNSDGSVFVSDDSLYTLDVAPGAINDPQRLERLLKSCTGVVDVGLFVGLATGACIGLKDGTVEVR
jgi:ribose 5-phosphate isomerase A